VIGPRGKKILRDVLQRPGRSALAVLALSAGMFEIGALLYKYAVLQPVLTTMYEKTRPASAVLSVNGLSDALVDSVRHVPGVADAEARPVLMARARTGPDEWTPVILNVIRDFDGQRIDTFEKEKGAWPPAPDQVLLERSALGIADVAIGDSLWVRTPGGEERWLLVAGTVHAAGLPPAWMDHFIPAFVSWDSEIRAGTDAVGSVEEPSQVRIVVADHPLEEGYIREVADSVKALLERERPHGDARYRAHAGASSARRPDGRLPLPARRVRHPEFHPERRAGGEHDPRLPRRAGPAGRDHEGPRRHHPADRRSLPRPGRAARHRRARARHPARPCGRARVCAILRPDPQRGRHPRAIPVWVIAIEIVVGLAVPLLFALGPVVRASRISIHEALAGDLQPRPFGTHGFERWLAARTWLPRPLLLSLRTTFARRARLALTLVLLALGGAAFMSAMNVSAAWDRAVRQDFSHRRYDLTVFLRERQPLDRIDALVRKDPDVVHVESWPGGMPYLIGAEGVAGGQVALVGPDPSTG
jgi:putative ABC transport system permease protein